MICDIFSLYYSLLLETTAITRVASSCVCGLWTVEDSLLCFGSIATTTTINYYYYIKLLLILLPLERYCENIVELCYCCDMYVCYCC